MRVLELHASMRPIKRSEGRSSVQMAAYITRTSMEDERTGETFDHTRKGGVEFTGLVAQDAAPEWALNSRTLWNSVERSAKRKDAQVARELEIGLPHEFTSSQRREAAMKIAHMLIRRYGGAAEYALHEPGEEGDCRNYHGHFLFTTSSFSERGEWAAKGRMVQPEDLPEGYDRSLPRNQKARYIANCALDDVVRGPKELERLRAEIATIQNEIAVREQHQIFVEHLSYSKRGIDKEATQHMGNRAAAAERRGEVTDIGTKNRDIAARNQERVVTREEIKVIEIDLAKERLKQKQQSSAPAPARTQEEEHAIFYREAYERRTAMLGAFERQHGQEEKKLRAQAAQLTGTIENAGFVTGLVRRVMGRTKTDRMALVAIHAKLHDIAQRREQKRTEFERDRQTRFDQMKAAQEVALQQEQAASLPLAVGEATATPGRVEEARAGGPTQQDVSGAYAQRRREYFRRLGQQRQQERESEQPASRHRRKSPAPAFEEARKPAPPEPAADFEQAASGDDAQADEALKRAQEANPLNSSAGEREIRREQEGGYVSPALSEADLPSNYDARKAAYLRRIGRGHEQSEERDTGPTRDPE